MERDIEKIISINLTELRKSRNLKQSELSVLIGYSDKTISRWENGSSVPDIATLVKLAEFYSVTLEDLITERAVEKSSEADKKKNKEEMVHDIATPILSCLIVWLVAALIYIGASLLRDIYMWQIFIWAIPISAYFIYYKIRKKFSIKWLNFLLLTLSFCGLVVAIFVQLLGRTTFWPIFVLLVPLEGIAIVNTFFSVKGAQKKDKKGKE